MRPCPRQNDDFTGPATGILTTIVRLSGKRGDGEVMKGKDSFCLYRVIIGLSAHCEAHFTKTDTWFYM